MRPIRHLRAFTLIEVLMVVVIIGIAGAIIMPQISSRNDLTAASVARVMTADLIYAQNLSITKQANQYAQFDVTAKRYTLVDSALGALTHPITRNSYVQQFGTTGSGPLKQTTLVSATFTGTSGSTGTTLGYDELGTPLVRLSTGTVETLVSGAIVIQCDTYKLQLAVEAYTGQITITSIP